jgi:hypothetical protein
MRHPSSLSGALLLTFCTSSALAQIPPALELQFNACAMKRSIAQTPDHYFVAVIEKQAQKPCAGAVCSDTWVVRKLIASKMPAAKPDAPKEILLPSVPGQSDPGKAEGTTAIGIFSGFVPGDANYLASLISFTVTPEREALYAKAVALASDTDAPMDCKPFFPTQVPSNTSLERSRYR